MRIIGCFRRFRRIRQWCFPARDPLQAELYENAPEITDGWLTLNEAPGLGLTLSEDAIKKYGERII